MRKQSIIICIFLIATTACKESKKTVKGEGWSLSQEFDDYWYDGTAEISTFDVQQARYGEFREGIATQIFVTEPFSTTSFTKDDNPTEETPTVLKLNFTRKYLTGIYPYSIMSSTFYPLNGDSLSYKISTSMQEWCGNTYMELIHDGIFEVAFYSYFQGESKDTLMIPTYLEDDVWSQIRIDQSYLPEGHIDILPSLTFLMLMHKEIKPYPATAQLTKGDSLNNYTIEYLTLERKLSIDFESAFPNKIVGWRETYTSGFGENQKVMTSTAVLKKRLKIDYWNKNANKHLFLRDSLGLEK
ncbi:MAG: septum formation inhibitor Maf [Crocinitomicaceae bacterium]